MTLPVVDFETAVTFTFGGQTVTAYRGDTIASALYRAGVRTFSRGFKYHRPRGLLCLSGSCPNCLVNVDGTPSTRSCMTPVVAGMQVTSQNAWPSLERDAMSIFDRLARFLPVGFYYKTFIFPRAFWPLYERVLRRAAGLGLISPDPEKFVTGHGQRLYYDKQYHRADVTVVGGGPAGLAAALAAAGQGARVTLVDENQALGGHLRFTNGGLPTTADRLPPFVENQAEIGNRAELARSLATAVHNHPAITVLTGAVAFGWYEDNLLAVSQGNRLIKLRTAQLIVAAGRIEQPLVFHNNDLPGIFLGTGLQRLMHLYGVKPGERALVVTANDSGWRVAGDLLAGGVMLVMVIDSRPQLPAAELVAPVTAAGVPVRVAYTIEAATGRQCVSGARVVAIDGQGEPVAGTTIDLACDLVALSTGFVANNALLYQSGSKLRYDPAVADVVPLAFRHAVSGAGHCVATRGLEAVLVEGYLAGLKAAATCRNGDGRAPEAQILQWQAQLDELKAKRHEVRPLASVASNGKKKFVCFCEDVTEKDVQDAIGEGFDNVETLKRYTTISMGPCQGKICSLNAIRLCARETGHTVAETGTTTSRPPFTPVKLGILAGRKMEPVRYTPMHRRHLDGGATMMDAGQWKRPEHYGDPLAEVRAVRERAGLIDVSSLGKIDVRGPGAVQLLERLYTNRFAKMAVGQSRYGVMCTDEGILFDDGVVCRLAEDHFYVTTTTGGVGGVYEWMTWWLAAWRFQVHVTNVTASYAAVNLAGPQARQVLGKLTDLDLSTAAFPYMHGRLAPVAGVPALLLRIGFVGEMGYEIHYPAGYGEHVWDALRAAGDEFRIATFGVEAQRILRLEKKHIIAGQDTDALADPLAAAMPSIVMLEKEDFIGKPSLALRHKRGLQEQLVGFVMAGREVVPLEGEQIVADGRLIGRVTSARYSPTLDQAIGMAWLVAEKAQEGVTVHIRTGGKLAEATVAGEPFYDPKGERLRS